MNFCSIIFTNIIKKTIDQTLFLCFFIKIFANHQMFSSFALNTSGKKLRPNYREVLPIVRAAFNFYFHFN